MDASKTPHGLRMLAPSQPLLQVYVGQRRGPMAVLCEVLGEKALIFGHCQGVRWRRMEHIPMLEVFFVDHLGGPLGTPHSDPTGGNGGHHWWEWNGG